MGYEQGAIGGTPVFLGGNNGGNGLLGGEAGGLGGLLLGGLLFGQGGIGGMFGGNRGMGWGQGQGMANGYYGGNVQGEQSAGITSLQGQLTALANTVNSNQVAHGMGQISEVVTDGISDVNSNLNSISRDLIAGQGNITNAITNNGFATLTNINGLSRDITAQNNNIALQQLNTSNILANQMNTGFNSLNTNSLQGFNEVGRDQANATNLITAQLNAMAAANAECCCSIKEKIGTDGGLTRQLINDVRLAELNAALTDAKLQNSNLEQTNMLNANNATQTTTILSHLSPYLSGIQGAIVEVNNVNRNRNTNN